MEAPHLTTPIATASGAFAGAAAAGPGAVPVDSEIPRCRSRQHSPNWSRNYLKQAAGLPGPEAAAWR